MSARLLLVVLAWAAPALAVGPFEKNHPLVDEGTAAYEAGDFERALDRYDAAAKERPNDARVHYDRGLALHKLGRNADARAAFTHAEELDKRGELTSKIHYNLGNLAAADGDKQAAIREYRRALRADPNDALARHNLEVLLRDLPPKESTGQDGGTPDGGKSEDGGRPDAGLDGGATDGGSDAGRPDGGPRDGGEGDGGTEDAGMDAGTDGGVPQDGGTDGGIDGGRGDGGVGDGGTRDGGSDGGQPTPDGGKADGGEAQKPEQADGGADGGAELMDGGSVGEAKPGADGGTDKKEAEKLLDSFKSNEKNLQLWRFKQKTQKTDTNGKDW